jgi:hypothetical protein
VGYEIELEASLVWNSAIQQIQALNEGMYSQNLQITMDALQNLRPQWMVDGHGLSEPLINPVDLLIGVFQGIFRSSLRSTAASTTQNNVLKMAVVRRLGDQGEAAVAQALIGASKLPSKTGILLPGMSKMRFPDYLNSTILIEVKNTKVLKMTPQIRDFMVCAQKLNVKFRIYYRPGASIDTAFDNLPVELVPIPTL